MSRVVVAESRAAEAALSIEVECDKCRARPADHGGKLLGIFFEMEPKKDTEVPFYLCGACWFDYADFDKGRALTP